MEWKASILATLASQTLFIIIIYISDDVRYGCPILHNCYADWKRRLTGYEVWGEPMPSLDLCTKLHFEALILTDSGDF